MSNQICPNCGATVANNENGERKFCTKCGAKLQVVTTPKTEYTPTTTYDIKEDYNQLPMKWYNFLVYFGLFAGAAINVISGISIFTSGSVRFVNVLYAFALFALAIGQISTRKKLVDFTADAPQCLYVLYGLSAGISFIYGLIMGNPGGSVLGSLILQIIVIVANVKYFNRRSFMFIN